MTNQKITLIGFLLLFVGALGFVSCDRVDKLSDIKDKSLNYEEFFEIVSNIGIETDQEKIVYIDFEWNSKDKTIKYLSSKEKEPDFFILENKMSLSKRKGEYQVSCDNDKDQGWDEDCDGKWSCGGLITKCLDEGGCATVCKRQMAYSPKTKNFYILN